MEKWRCTICGYIVDGDKPEKCPLCAAAQELFEKVVEQVAASKWQCSVCGYMHDGSQPPDKCPLCGAAKEKFNPVAGPASPSEQTAVPSLDTYLSEWSRKPHEDEEKFSTIHKLAKTGTSEISPMGTRHAFPGLESILFKGTQLKRFPLNEDEAVSTKTVIGSTAKQPLELELPFYVSHMSFGALSREAKISLAKGSAKAGTATCSGEGGMLEEERQNASKYIYEIGTALYTRNEGYIKAADAVEIKIGQAAKPGMGGHLPGEKVTDEIAAVRQIEKGKSFISPNRQPGVKTVDDLKKLVESTRELTGGKPVGIKFAAGHIEDDIDFALAAEPDFITLDCRGGATGAAPAFIRDNICVPAVLAIRRARKHLDANGSKVTLCVTGGFRDSTDVAKALALGADAVALATAAMIAIGCQQYRICNSGKCPVGIATQDPELRKRFNVDASVQRFVNYADATREELETLARVNGRADVNDLCLGDIFTINSTISAHTDIQFQ